MIVIALYKTMLDFLDIEVYWRKIQETGLGLSDIDNLVTLIILIRFVLIFIRYNLATSLIITLISVIAGYLWYTTFISTLFTYEHALYKNSLTIRLGLDINQIKRVLQAKVISSTYQIRLTNPTGIILYALGNGSVYEGYRIDPVSMFMSIIPEKFPKYHLIEGTYYLFYRKIIPLTIRIVSDLMDAFSSYTTYNFMTRVNKRYCPYLIRWHWTLLLLLKFCEPFITYLLFRIGDYASKILYPQILKAKEYGLSTSQLDFEMNLLTYISFTIIIVHLAFIFFAMLHALCGQYFYIPFFTENVELHIGERNKFDPYSGGHTAWQDKKYRGKFKLWYGWFGRGTDKQNIFRQKIIKFFKFIKRLILKLKPRD